MGDPRAWDLGMGDFGTDWMSRKIAESEWAKRHLAKPGETTLGEQLMNPIGMGVEIGQRTGIIPSNRDLLLSPITDYATGGGPGMAQNYLEGKPYDPAGRHGPLDVSDYVQQGPTTVLPGGFPVPIPLPGKTTRSAAQYMYDKFFGSAGPDVDKEAKATLKSQRDEAGSQALPGPGDLTKRMLAGAGFGGMGTTPTGSGPGGAPGVAGQGGGSDNYGGIEKQKRLERYYETEAKKQEYEGVRREVQMREDMANEQSARASSAEVAHEAAMSEAKKHLELEDQAMKKWSQVKVDPSRIWNGMDGFDRANWHAGVAIGGFLRDLRGGGENEFLSNYNNLVDRDVKAQILQADKFKGLAEHEGNMFSQLQKMGMSKLDAASKVSEMMHQSMLDRIKGVAMNTANEADAERARKLVPALEGQILSERQKRQEAAAARAAAAADKAYNRWFELQKLGIEAGKIRAAGQGDADKRASDLRERTVVGPGGQGVVLNRKEDAKEYTEKLQSLNNFRQKVEALRQAQANSGIVGRGLGAAGSKVGTSALDTEETKKLKFAKGEVLAAYSKANGLGALDKGLQQFGENMGLGTGEWDPFSVDASAYESMLQGVDKSIGGLSQAYGGQAISRQIDPNTGLETQVPENLLLGPGLGARKTPVGNVGP